MSDGQGKKKPTDEKKYFILCNRHNWDGLWTFWGSDFCGYTSNIKRAGIYSKSELKQSGYNLVEVTKENAGKCLEYEDFVVEVDNIEILGEKRVCIVK